MRGSSTSAIGALKYLHTGGKNMAGVPALWQGKEGYRPHRAAGAGSNKSPASCHQATTAHHSPIHARLWTPAVLEHEGTALPVVAHHQHGMAAPLVARRRTDIARHWQYALAHVRHIFIRKTEGRGQAGGNAQARGTQQPVGVMRSLAKLSGARGCPRPICKRPRNPNPCPNLVAVAH